MATLWEIGLANALVVAIVAPLAFVLARAAKRPAWVHAVWVVVLLKLVTPPVASWPVARSWFARTERVVAVPTEVEVVEAVVPRAPAPLIEIAPMERRAVAVEPIAVPPKRAVSVSVVLGSIWLMGSGFWVMVAAWRIARFARAVRRADDAPGELVEWVEELSSRIGLARSPRVVVAPVRVAPMVWALGGRPCLLVPEALWGRLDHEQRAAMLIHELAHLRRRDHWVRILELVATGLYWWHPALWLARRELHRAEEECCDLWVVWALPKAKRTYASALVEAVEFLSEGRPTGLPIGASGMGQVEDLSRRIGMIMRGDTPRGLTRAGTLAVLGLGLLLLPWRPTIAQDAPKGDDVKPPAEVAKGTVSEQELKRAEERVKWAEAMVKKGYISQQQLEADRARLLESRARLASIHQGGDDAFAAARAQMQAAEANEQRMQQMHKQGAVSAQEVAAAQAEVLTMKARLAALQDQARKEVTSLQAAIQEAQYAVEMATGNLLTHQARVAKAESQREVAAVGFTRISRLVERNAASKEELDKAKAEMAVADATINEAKAEHNQARIEVEHAKRRFAALQTQANGAAPNDISAKRLARTTAGLRTVTAEDLAKLASQDPRVAEFADVTAKPAPRDPNARIDELEAKLNRVLKELEAMRKDGLPKRGSTAPADDPAKPPPGNPNVTMDEYRRLNTELAKLKIDRYKAEVTVKYLEDELKKFGGGAAGQKTDEQIDKMIMDEFVAHPQAAQLSRDRDDAATKYERAKARIENPRDPSRQRAKQEVDNADQAYNELWTTMYPILRRRVLEAEGGGKADAAALQREQNLSTAKLELRRVKLHEKLLEEQIKDASVEVNKAQDQARGR